MSINILILAAGPAKFEARDGGYPVCLTEVDGTPLLEHLVEKTREIRDAHYVYALLDEDLERFHLDHVIQLITPGATVVSVPKNTQGSACTALLAVSGLRGDDELLMISANELVDVNLADVLANFRCDELDGGTITFRSVHPRYSYVRINDQGFVTEAAQQNPISRSATAGVFWFARTADFVEGAKNLIRKNANVEGKFYVAPVYNELILKQKRIGAYSIESTYYHPLKTERQMHKFEQGLQE